MPHVRIAFAEHEEDQDRLEEREAQQDDRHLQQELWLDKEGYDEAEIDQAAGGPEQVRVDEVHSPELDERDRQIRDAQGHHRGKEGVVPRKEAGGAEKEEDRGGQIEHGRRARRVSPFRPGCPRLVPELSVPGEMEYGGRSGGDMSKEERWRQRFRNLLKAYTLFQEAATAGRLSVLESEGRIHRFEYTFELAWKTLKDYLEAQGVSATFPREVIKAAFQESLAAVRQRFYPQMRELVEELRRQL